MVKNMAGGFWPPVLLGEVYVIIAGDWIFSEKYDEWSYVVNGEKLRDTWAFLYNPYGNAAMGQQVFSLYYFNGSGVMVTGDMIIDGKLYSFHSKKDGTRGRLLGYIPSF